MCRQNPKWQLDLLAKLNERHRSERPDETELLGRIESFELAYRMQAEATELVDFSTETAETRKMYGVDENETRSFGSKCLMARRLIERGVRFVQVYSDGEWDAHSDLAGNHRGHCRATDRPIDALLTDLKRTGLIDSTLVIWGGEFGRMPVSQGNGGRDHNPNGFGMFFTGAGIRKGTSYGELDEIGFKAAVDRVSVHDLHATMLHLLGIDHERLTYLHNGRRYRLTDVAGEVLHKILASRRALGGCLRIRFFGELGGLTPRVRFATFRRERGMRRARSGLVDVSIFAALDRRTRGIDIPRSPIGR